MGYVYDYERLVFKRSIGGGGLSEPCETGHAVGQLVTSGKLVEILVK